MCPITFNRKYPVCSGYQYLITMGALIKTEESDFWFITFSFLYNVIIYSLIELMEFSKSVLEINFYLLCIEVQLIVRFLLNC